MIKIETFPFKKNKLDQLKKYHFGLNWPVVYVQEGDREMYIGQTTNLYSRSNQHYENPDRARLKNLHVLTDEEFNLSAAYDFESLLIQYVSADGLFKLQNGNGGLINHNYYDKEKYLAKLKAAWPLLQEKGLVKKDLEVIKNSEFFKYSPYKALTEDQLVVADQLEAAIKSGQPGTHIVNGGPGTGKSILALYLLKHLKEMEETRHLKTAIVVSMSGLRSTLQAVLARVPGMGAAMVIGPNDVARDDYDLLIVDEAHRLRRRVNLTNFASYDATNKNLGLPKEATQLDWIMNCSKQQIFFYDRNQSIVPGDVRESDFKRLENVTHYNLTSQMRVLGGENYLQFIDDIFDLKKVADQRFENYEFTLYESIHEMIEAIKRKDKEHSLARVVAGYAWPWRTRDGEGDYDIEIDGLKLIWNSTNINWVNSENSVNEVGCIHTVQGYDLNYAGVIIGPELSYDNTTNKLVVDREKYMDINGRRSISDPEELRQYIINIYKTLLTRGIKGTFVYIVDENLRNKFKELCAGVITGPTNNTARVSRVAAPASWKTISVPLVGSAPCGKPFLGEENIEEYIEVDSRKIHKGFKYFIVRAEGDSMDLAGIKNGDLLLCRQQEKADTGDKVIALLGGDNVTIKEYGPRESGIRLLLPRSSSKRHQSITPGRGDSVQGVVQEVI